MDQIMAGGLDITATDLAGGSLSHHLLCHPGMANLLVGGQLLPFERTAPFPWHLEWRRIREMAFLNSDFKRYKRRMPLSDFRRILNMEPRHGWSPLCMAAMSNSVTTIENLLSVGADIDFHGSIMGPPLFLAVFYGRLATVRLLIGRGAKTSHRLKDGAESTCVLDIADYKHIREWLLVGRFVGLRRLTWSSASQHGQDSNHDEIPLAIPCLWSGVLQLAYDLTHHNARRPNESCLEHARRLRPWRKEMQGKVVTAHPGSLVHPVKPKSLL